MIAPYQGRFQETQTYNPPTHKGLDLVGLDSKRIYSTVDGTVVRVGWENPNDHNQGWGQRIVIKETGSNRYFYFGHLSRYSVSVNQTVTVGQLIGVEGNTGHSTGSHLHYEARLNDDANQPLDISAISGIPNALGIYDAGTTPPTPGDPLSGWIIAIFKLIKYYREGRI